PKTLGLHLKPHYEKEKTMFEAIISGANSGVRMIVGIVALLIAVLGFVALLDLVLSGLGEEFNSLTGISFDWTLKAILGYLFYPFALIIGVPPQDSMEVAKLIGERLVVTEVVAYKDLALLLKSGVFQYRRSPVIAAYALCGFAHLASMSIFVGGISALAPKRTSVLARVAFRALVAATLACLLTACVAGIFFCENSVLLGNL
ncbi:MAG: nucleoside transporter, partial [Candidatus Omnitrophica bacterium]|nr:nucleoside transporter [Candidatus Omnitrophota bacterium]MBD3268858.1 nucleoside transporter [Candidatus Omnitrophota bacterium]